MKLGLMLFIVLVSLFAKAQETELPSTVHALLAYGGEVRPDRDVNSNLVIRNLSNFAIGAGDQTYIGILERAFFSEDSGNSTLNVTRKFENYLLWAQWRALKWHYLSPFLGAGIGIYKEKVETFLSVAPSASNETNNKVMAGASFGISSDIKWVWLSIEGRVLVGDELNPQPSLGAVTRVGLWF